MNEAILPQLSARLSAHEDCRRPLQRPHPPRSATAPDKGEIFEVEELQNKRSFTSPSGAAGIVGLGDGAPLQHGGFIQKQVMGPRYPKRGSARPTPSISATLSWIFWAQGTPSRRAERSECQVEGAPAPSQQRRRVQHAEFASDFPPHRISLRVNLMGLARHHWPGAKKGVGVLTRS